jgi:DHA2 family multidrug resistance protein-like MFS transporter
MNAVSDVMSMKAGRKEWIGLAVIALPCLIYSMDLTVLHMAVPQLSRDLNPSSTQLLWIIDIYGFMVAGFLIATGSLGDRIGRRRLLMIGGGAFGLASIAAAFSRSAEMLIVTRALLGIAGATVAPSTLSLIRNMFHDEHERTRAISIWIIAYSLGGIVGPLVGGVLLEYFWWGSVFLIAVPVMGLLLILGPILLPEYRDPNAGRADLVSSFMSLSAVLTIIFGLKRIAAGGVGALAVAAILTGVVIGWLFVRRQLRLADPLIDLRLFRLPAFSAALATYGLTTFLIFGGFLFLPQFLQLVRGLSPLQAGMWTIPWAVAFVAGSWLTPPLAKRMRRGPLIAGGLVVTALSYGMLAAIDAGTGFAWFAIATSFMALGASPVVTLTTDLIVGSAPPERAGAASAISETSAEFGGAVGIAVFGSIGVAVYRVVMDARMPAGVPATIAEQLRATLGGAADAVASLPAALQGPALAATQEAFVRGLQLCAIVSAVGTMALAVFASRMLRRMN